MNRLSLAIAGVALLLAVYFEIGSVFAILFAMYLIFSNLGQGRGEGSSSAYAVFNDGQQALPGTIDASQYDSALRSGNTAMSVSNNNTSGSVASLAAQVAGDELVPLIRGPGRSRLANRPCPCGSGKKYKKCCGKIVAHTAEDEQARREWERDWT